MVVVVAAGGGGGGGVFVIVNIVADKLTCKLGACLDIKGPNQSDIWWIRLAPEQQLSQSGSYIYFAKI